MSVNLCPVKVVRKYRKALHRESTKQANDAEHPIYDNLGKSQKKPRTRNRLSLVSAWSSIYDIVAIQYKGRALLLKYMHIRHDRFN